MHRHLSLPTDFVTSPFAPITSPPPAHRLLRSPFNCPPPLAGAHYFTSPAQDTRELLGAQRELKYALEEAAERGQRLAEEAETSGTQLEEAEQRLLQLTAAGEETRAQLQAAEAQVL